MTDHPTLFDNLRAEERATAGDLADRDDRIGRAFSQYHRDNPEVYARLVKIARRYRDGGLARGIGFFFEVLRHERMMAGSDAQGFKLNNNFRSRYARLIERECPDLRGFFRKRTLTAAGAR